MRRLIYGTLVAILLAITMLQAGYIKYQHEVISVLIDLNHDKSVYIDAGCQGRYQGTEEMLP